MPGRRRSLLRLAGSGESGAGGGEFFEKDGVDLASQLKQFMWVMFGCGLPAKLFPESVVVFARGLVWHRTSSARSFGSGVRYQRYAASANIADESDRRIRAATDITSRLSGNRFRDDRVRDNTGKCREESGSGISRESEIRGL